MTDLVKRLRTYMPDGQDDTIHSEAADRIEELEAQVKSISEDYLELKRLRKGEALSNLRLQRKGERK